MSHFSFMARKNHLDSLTTGPIGYRFHVAVLPYAITKCNEWFQMFKTGMK